MKIQTDVFLKLFRDIPEMFYNISKCLQISSMSVSPLVGLLPYWNLANGGISPVLDEICLWNLLETFLGCVYTIFQTLQFHLIGLIWLILFIWQHFLLFCKIRLKYQNSAFYRIFNPPQYLVIQIFILVKKYTGVQNFKKFNLCHPWGQVMWGLIRFSQVCSGQVRSSHVSSCRVKSGQFGPGQGRLGARSG